MDVMDAVLMVSNLHGASAWDTLLADVRNFQQWAGTNLSKGSTNASGFAAKLW
jgi:hypothetical protein